MVKMFMRNLIAPICIPGIVFLFLLGCKGSENKQEPVDFPYVQVPSYITDQQLAVDYLARNFWDKFFTLVPDEQLLETTVYGVDSLSFDNSFQQYARLLSMASAKSRDVSVKNLFANLDILALQGNRKPLLAVMDRAEHYLYNPLSVLLNEEIYLSILNGILQSEALSDLEKMQYEYQHKICSLNRLGMPAADFSFRQIVGNFYPDASLLSGGLYASYPPNGYADKSLYKDVKGEYTLLFFNNPDCHSCEGILGAIKGSVLAEMALQGVLKILAIYIDEDLGAWLRNREKFPEEWIYAFDHNKILRENNIYGLRAIPSLYLLDKEKRVILKDAPVDMVISYFQR